MRCLGEPFNRCSCGWWASDVRKWWNWQTHHLEGVAPKGVRVQVPPSAPYTSNGERISAPKTLRKAAIGCCGWDPRKNYFCHRASEGRKGRDGRTGYRCSRPCLFVSDRCCAFAERQERRHRRRLWGTRQPDRLRTAFGRQRSHQGDDLGRGHLHDHFVHTGDHGHASSWPQRVRVDRNSRHQSSACPEARSPAPAGPERRRQVSKASSLVVARLFHLANGIGRSFSLRRRRQDVLVWCRIPLRSVKAANYD